MQNCDGRIKVHLEMPSVSQPWLPASFLHNLTETGKGNAAMLYQDQASPEDAKCILVMAASLSLEQIDRQRAVQDCCNRIKLHLKMPLNKLTEEGQCCTVLAGSSFT